jgi:hypothetical protein
VEDGFNHMKNDKVMLKNRKMKRPERALATVLHRQALSKVHHYDEVDRCSIIVARRGLELKLDVFRCTPVQASLPFRGMVSTMQSPDWWSPSVDRVFSPVADLAMIDVGIKLGCLPQLRNCWMGCLLRWEHQVLVRQPAQFSGWAFAMGTVGDSAVLLWPANEVTATHDGNTLVYFEPKMQLVRPLFATVFDLQGWEAVSYAFHSPAWLHQHPAGRAVPARILPVRTTAPMPLTELAALNGFWELSLPVVQRLAQHLGCFGGCRT